MDLGTFITTVFCPGFRFLNTELKRALRLAGEAILVDQGDYTVPIADHDLLTRE